MARPYGRTISIGTLNALADEIEEAVYCILAKNGQGKLNAQAVFKLYTVCDYLRDGQSSQDLSIERKSIASCGNSQK